MLQRAWSQVRRNNGAPGIDQITLAEVEEYGVQEAGQTRTGAEAEPEPAHRQAVPAQAAKAGLVRQLRLTKSIDTGTPSSLNLSRTWFSTQ